MALVPFPFPFTRPCFSMTFFSLRRPRRLLTSLPSRPLLALGLGLALGPGLACANNAVPIAWTAAQAEAAGVVTQAIAPSTKSLAGAVLQGSAELPPHATELLSTPLSGVVQQVLVRPGQQVKAGEVVARLLSPELVTWQRELLQAQAQERLAADKLDRDEKLYAEGIIAGLRLQESRTQYRLAQIASKERQEVLRLAGASGDRLRPELAVRAAAAGTVLEVLATPGKRLDAGMPVAELARNTPLSLTLEATREQVQDLRVGDTLSVKGCQTKARLAAIVPHVNSANQTIQLRADMLGREDCLRVHQFVQATVTDRASPTTGLVLPAEAVVRRGGQAYVFVQTAQGFVPTRIDASEAKSSQVQVRSGLRGDERIAVRGLAALKGAWLGLGSEAP